MATTDPKPDEGPEPRLALTPIDDLKAQLASVPADKTPVVLLTTGSYCPVHVAHLQVHTEAAAALSRLDPSLVVVQSYISPSHDAYVESKMRRYGRKDYHLDIEERFRCCELAVKDTPLVSLDKWEGAQPDFVDFPSVMYQLQTWLDALADSGTLSRRCVVFMLVGADMLKTHIHRTFPARGVPLMVALRHGTDITKHYMPRGLPSVEDQIAKRCFFFETSMTGSDFSSSEIHRRLKMGQSIKELVHPDVHEFLMEKHGDGRGASTGSSLPPALARLLEKDETS